ncbi:DUF2207 domain-containing protein [Sphingomonas sp.]|uniref:DUF2207 domain-containing protein n=1 Tax=Sphingomonas sp. TaxID=28214 RepID=UPI003D6CCFE5
MRGLPRLLAALALLVAVPAGAQERITSFVSDVQVGADGTLDVVETIHIVAAGDQIKRGIRRDFPTSYRNGIGRNIVVGFEMVSVARDGHPEPYKLMGMANGRRVQIGDADTLLPSGEHVYRIQYRTTRQIGFYRDFDELYWNATGTGWAFPIEQAEARITLPAAVPFGKRAVYTGEQGATAQDAAVVDEQPGRIVFRTTQPLGQYEGLTIAVAWRKGVVAQPSTATRLGWALRENGAMLLAIVGLLGILAYLALTWWRVKRNPDPRPVVPLFSPPDDLSAAALRLIWRMDFDNRAFSAAIVDVAVRGWLRIVEAPGSWGKPSRTLEETAGSTPLPAAEQKMFGQLFKGRRTTIELTQDNYESLSDARAALGDGLDRSLGEDRYFSDAAKKSFLGWTLFGGLFLLVALFVALVDTSNPLLTIFGVVGGLVAGLVALRLLSWARKKTRARKGGWRILSWIATVLIWMTVPMFAVALIAIAVTSYNPLALILPLIAIPFIAVTQSRLRAPTAEGWPMRDRILGFRHYLSVTEEERLEALNPPEKTAALFERYLPYAIALEVENRWAKRFTGVLAAAAADGTTTPSVSWYSGSSDPWNSTTAFVSTVGASLSSTIASAATSPASSSSDSSSDSSSSGSSGGGSSGGGGGGGGGSGW